VPSKKALKIKAQELNKGRALKPCQAKAIDDLALAIVVPKPSHQTVSPTYGQSAEAAAEDAKDLQGSAKRDLDEMQKHMKDEDMECLAAYKKAAAQIRKVTNRQYTNWLKKCLASC